MSVDGRWANVLISIGAGLHGAKVVISGRRQQVLTDACEALTSEGITALGVQARSWLLRAGRL